MYLFRIHIRPSGGSANIKDTFGYCLKNDLLGVGWRTESNKSTKIWEEYYAEASQLHDNLNVCKYIEKWISKGDLVWTRDPEGRYYIARVVSGWEYWISPEAIAVDIDIANVFRVEFRPVEIDAVPGKIIAAFRAPRTIQEIADKKALEYSKHLWNFLSNDNIYQIDKSNFADIFMMLDAEETEDLIFLYLQSKGWYVLPNSRKGDTMSFEYLAVNPKTNERALTQVKTGNTPLNKDEYQNWDEKIFLFQANEIYNGTGNDNIYCITRAEITTFLSQAMSWLPATFRNKLALVNAK